MVAPRHFTFWIAAFPDVNRPLGGIKQLHRTCECIQEIGYEVFLIQDSENYHPSWFNSRVNTINRDTWFKRASSLDPLSNFLILPETLVPVSLHWAPSIKRIIFNQNTSYTYGLYNSQRLYKISRINEYYRSDNVAQVWCVSEYDNNFLIDLAAIPGCKVKQIANFVDTSEIQPEFTNLHQISYMPRKNPRHSSILLNCLSSSDLLKEWKVVSIDKMNQSDVFKVLSDSSIFLSFGYPEGFGLPVAEAMSLGCVVVGYSGLGGSELFDIGKEFGTSYDVAFGDLTGFKKSIHTAISTFTTDLFFAHKLEKVSELIRSKYSKSSMIDSLSNAIDSL